MEFMVDVLYLSQILSGHICALNFTAFSDFLQVLSTSSWPGKAVHMPEIPPGVSSLFRAEIV